MSAIIDPSYNFHPYECDGPGECPHCDREISTKHNPDTCALCDEQFDAAIIRRREDGPSDTEIYGAGS